MPDEAPDRLAEPSSGAAMLRETAKCTACCESVPSTEIEERNGVALCAECTSNWDESHTTCDRCEDSCRREDTVSVYTRTYRTAQEEWCDTCFSLHSWRCPECEDTYSDSVTSYSVHNGDDGEICRNCLCEYSRCSTCREYYPNDDMYGGQCPGCYENYPDDDDDEDRELIHDYHDDEHRPEWIFHGNDREIFYGVELEINAPTQTASETLALLQSPYKEHVFLERDSTIRSGGYEIISHPHTLAEHHKLWAAFLKNPPEGITSYKTGECGMHIHIERKKLSKLQIQKILVFINAPENETFITAIAQREPTQWCQRKPKKITHNADEHHEAFFLGNRNTCELRIFRGVLRPDRFWKNLEFADALVWWTRNISYRDLTYTGFVSFVKEHRTEYRYLFAYLVETDFTTAPLKDIVKETLAECA